MTVIRKMANIAQALISACRVPCSKISNHVVLQAWKNPEWQSESPPKGEP
ncbi:MAG: hypothetical protein ACK5IJ_08115 [Mangrovibacterium sp.]